jgi:hypothetical protein
MEEEWAKGKVASGEEEESFDDIIKAGTEEEIKVTPKNLEILQTRVSKLEEEKAFRVGEQVCLFFFAQSHTLSPHTHSLTHSLTQGRLFGMLRALWEISHDTRTCTLFHTHSHSQTHSHSHSHSHTHTQTRTGASIWGAARLVGSHTRFR